MHSAAGATGKMIEVRSLTKTFAEKKRGLIRAVDAISFRVEAGQI